MPTQAGAEAPKEGKAKKKLSDAQVRQTLIDESIAVYSGNYPCPYNRAVMGRVVENAVRTTELVAKPPLCFAHDVSAEMVQAYRDAHAAE